MNNLAHGFFYKALSDDSPERLDLFIKSARLFKYTNRLELVNVLIHYFNAIDELGQEPINEFKKFYEVFKSEGDSGLDWYLFNRKNVVVETDIGFDPDDMIALTALLKAPNINIKLIVPSEDKQGYRAHVIDELLRRGDYSIPIVSGPDTNNNCNVFIKKESIVNNDYIESITSLLDNELIYYVNLSSLTNLNHLINSIGVPDNLLLIQMGGSSFKREYNFNLDFESARNVLLSGVKTKLITSEVTNVGEILIDRDSFLYKTLNDNPLHKLIKQNINYFFGLSPFFLLHDPLTAFAVIDESIFDFKATRVLFLDNGFNEYDFNDNSSIETPIKVNYASFINKLINLLKD